MFRFIKRLFWLVLFTAFAGVLCIGAIAFYVNKPVEHEVVILSIEPGMSVGQIANELENAGVIKCAACFKAYIRLMNYQTRLRAGDYEFKSGLTPRKVTTMFLNGDFKKYMVTFIEGWTIKQMEDYLRTLLIIKDPAGFVTTFDGLKADQDFIALLGIGWEVPNLEGYLFPDTYEVYKLDDPKKLISKMTGEFVARFSAGIPAASATLGLTPHQIVTLASIVEKETAVPEERPLVASVFYNRIKKGMFLQSDPTIIYGLKDYNGNIRKGDILNPHPYNTYVHAGLPPGPICSPGAASIEAVLNPASTNYLFFVSKNDGTHFFSDNISDHNKAVWKYQRNGGE